MQNFSRNQVLSRSFFTMFGIALALGVIFSLIFYFFPFRSNLLNISANISLGLAVFCGAYDLALHTPFFVIKNTFLFIFGVLTLLLLCTFLFGSLDISVFSEKTILIIAAAICGEIFGRI